MSGAEPCAGTAAAAGPVRIGGWRVWLSDAAAASGGDAAAARAWVELAALAETTEAPLHRSKHAATYRVARGARDVYLKVYRRYRVGTAVKDLARRSKARHALLITRRLAAARFGVPRILAAAEDRRGPWVRRAWIATAPIAGAPLADELRALGAAPCAAERLAAKRALLAALGAEVARLHAAGFIAGDLVPANVWVARQGAPSRLAVDGGGRRGEVRTAAGAALSFVFLDHDRTRAVGGSAPWWRARRNLVQLNRVVLPGVVLTDRLRVYRAYASTRGWTATRARRRLGWIVAKTIERRRRFDHVLLDPRAAVSFRQLMRAGGPFAPADARRRTDSPDDRARGREEET